MDSRTPFIKEVAKTIAENHAKGSESFIFGISGKWGEGKTYFLHDLKKELKSRDSSFEIFDVNAWKFSADNISFLRNFLKALYQKSDFWTEDDFRSLYFDTSESGIHWKRFATLVLVLGAAGWVYSQPEVSSFINGLAPQWKIISSLILIPTLLAAVGKIVIIQKSDHAISTLDKFDDLLKRIIAQFNIEQKKVVVFVDDLDRVTPEVARDVLDNLRTFFDKKELTFVVTGDHTVLERYLGKDLLPDEDVPTQLEEGRRFLKKIFNVYWRLPLPIENEVAVFVENEFTKRSSALNEMLTEEEDRNKFKNYLKKYFEKNFRQIIRFLDTTLFNFQIIKQKVSDGDDTQKRYFEEVAKHPLLIIRILMIQELCAPLFEKILNEPQILSDLEYAVDKKDSAKVNQIVDDHKKYLSDAQQGFIKKFLYEEPRFYEGTNLTVSDLRPFLFLAADASFGDQRGPSSDDFMIIVDGGDPAQVKSSLVSIGETKARAGAKAFITQLTSLAEPAKTNHIKTLVIALGDLPPEYVMHKIFAEELASVDLSSTNTTASANKLGAFNAFWAWLDIVKDASLLASYQDKFPFTSASEIDAIKIDKAGVFTSSVATRWLKTYYSQDTQDAVNKMLSIFPKLDLPEVHKHMAGMEEALANELIRDANAEWREKRFSLIKDFTPEGKKVLRQKIFEQASALNKDIVRWAIGKSGDLWETTEVETAVLEKLETAQNFNDIATALRFIVDNKISSPELLWPKVIPKHATLLIDNLPQMINESYQAISPSEEYASQIMDPLIQKIKGLGEAEQIQWLDYIKKPKWLWAKITKKPSVRKFAAIQKSTNDQLKQALTDSLASWDESA
ncbi:MAG: hypothetical protein KGJ89_04305 [Patescibacteria group bacterium]|nr:KAP family NTPase [Patescibacteria group bacterium]MDE2015344.1 hypothetical protein [Patescibacteria group bacterium]MDE2227149.1 hypothetical protein [Patescibacteria group bacterium]